MRLCILVNRCWLPNLSEIIACSVFVLSWMGTNRIRDFVYDAKKMRAGKVER